MEPLLKNKKMSRDLNLTDNPNVTVFHWQKFLPKDYERDRNLTGGKSGGKNIRKTAL
jgi:hypothetical protein